MSDDRTNEQLLVKKMIDYANKHKLPADHEMRTKAAALANCIAGFPLTISARGLYAHWAAALRVWSDLTGETMIS